MLVFVAMLASCSHPRSPLSASDRVGLEGAWARVNSIRTALNGHSRAVGFLFGKEDPYGPRGKAAIRRASLALHAAHRRAAEIELPESLEAEERRVQESMDAMPAAWRRHVPRLRSTLAGHEELSLDDQMILAEDVQNDLDQSLEEALYEVSVLSCEASDGEWNADDEYCTG